MFDIFFGWRKASKCKKLIKRAQCRLKLLKNKRNSMVKQLREDVAQLIKLGYEDVAFNRVEQLFKDECIIAVYDMLDNFCEFVSLQLPYIRRNKDCPNDINEAVSSLIFASARFADLPELPEIRKLFGERYGQRFATVALDLLPGNLVNREIKEKLSIKSVSDDVKYRLFDEIVRDYCLKPEILALEYFPEVPEQPLEKEISEHQEVEGNNNNSDSDAEVSNVKSIEVGPLALSESVAMRQCQSNAYPNSDAICTTSLKQKDDERVKAASSSESLPQFSEEAVVYLDDIEELQCSKTKDGEDQIVFKFKSPAIPKRRPETERYDDESCTDHDEKSSSKVVSSKSRNSYTKRSRRRSLSLENSSMKDNEHEIYYEKPNTNSPIHKHKPHHHIRKLQKKRLKQPCCSLEHPCYLYTGGDEWEEQHCHCQHSCNGEQFITIDENVRRRSYDNGASVHEVWTKPKLQKEKSIGKVKEPDVHGNHVSSKTRKAMPVSPYLRAMTMPQERAPRENKYSVQRSNSLSFQNPNHVHPKLPDYDDLAAKFMALKKERLLYGK